MHIIYSRLIKQLAQSRRQFAYEYDRDVRPAFYMGLCVIGLVGWFVAGWLVVGCCCCNWESGDRAIDCQARQNNEYVPWNAINLYI